MFIISTKKFSVNKKSPNIRFYFWSQFFAGDRHWMGLELLHKNPKLCCRILSFQCPHGLELLLVQTVQDFHRVMSQCPHGLELLRYVLDQQELMRTGFNALTGLSCYVTYTEDLSSVAEVSMPSRAYTSFLRYPFRNLDFMRFPEPVFAGIYQNILTTAIFRAC